MHRQAGENDWQAWAKLLAPPLLFLALFLNKPFHIDDTLFLTMSDLMPWTFFGEAGGEAYFLGQHYAHLNPYESTHPLFISWFLKCLDAISGSGVPRFWVFHAGFLVFPALMLIFLCQLTREMSNDPKWLWLVAASPVFFVNSTNLMADVAMTAFWCGTIAGALRTIRARHPWYWWQTVICFIAALWTSYQSVALFPLVGMLLLVCRAFRLQDWALLAIPCGGLLGYLLAAYAVSGFFPFLASTIDINIASEVSSGFSGALMGHKLIATFDFLGLGLLGFTPVLFLQGKSRQNFRLIAMWAVWLLILLGVFLSTDVLGSGYGRFGKAAISFLVSIGSFWSAWILWQAWLGLQLLRSDPQTASMRLLGSCLFLGVTFYNVVLLPYGTARYVLPALPGALILLVATQTQPLKRWLIWPVLLGTLALSLFMTRVDYQQARADWLLYQHVTAKAAQNQIVRFSDDAGLVRYFKEGTGHYLASDERTLEADELLLVTRGLIHPEVLKQVRLIEKIELPTFWGWTLFDTQARAGFYRSLDGLLPLARAEVVRRAFLYRVIWFENTLDQVEEIQMGNPNYFRRAAAEFPEQGTKHGLFMHPDVTVGFPWSQQKPVAFQGVVCPLPASWDKAGDGVTCSIGIRVGEDMRTLWEQTVDAKNSPADRAGVAFKVTIPAEAELIWLKVGPGPLGDYRHDSMLWYDLALTPATGRSE